MKNDNAKISLPVLSRVICFYIHLNNNVHKTKKIQYNLDGKNDIHKINLNNVHKI